MFISFDSIDSPTPPDSTDSLDSLDSTDSTDFPEILVCTHCGWFLTGEEVEMIDNAVAANGKADRFQIENILCPKCLKRPVLAPLSTAKLVTIMNAGTRLNDTARRLFAAYNAACDAGQFARARDLHARYRLFQNRLQAVLDIAKERSMEVQG